MASNQKFRPSIGIDLGGTKILACAVDENKQIVGRHKRITPAADGPDAVIMAIDSAARELCAEIDWNFDEIPAVGVAIPAPIDPADGVVENAANLGWVDFPAKDALEKLMKKKIHLENDVNAGTYGECVFGVGQGYRDVLGIFIGTGIGGGIVLNGKLHRGMNKAAGEIGHMVIKAYGHRQGQGFPGTFESMASRIAIQRFIIKKIKAGKRCVLAEKYGDSIDDPNLRIKSGALKKAAKAGDAVVLEALDRCAKFVGMHCAGLINYLGPEMIILGGGVVEKLERFLFPVILKTVEEYTFEITRRNVKIVAAELGDDAVPLGVAALAQEL